MNARLAYGNNYLEIASFFHDSVEFVRGNPYNTTFNLLVESGVFRGVAPIEYDIREFKKFVTALQLLYNFKTDFVQLDDLCYGSKVEFTMDRVGHLEVSGIIFGEAMEHTMKFNFCADQTALYPFILELDKLLDQI